MKRFSIHIVRCTDNNIQPFEMQLKSRIYLEGGAVNLSGR